MKDKKNGRREELSESTENKNTLFSNLSLTNEEIIFAKKGNKCIKKIFEVFHKKEIISNELNKPENINIKYKCIYCGNKYNNFNRFEAHMRIHVS